MKFLFLFLITFVFCKSNLMASEFTPLVGFNLGYGFLSGQDKESDKNGANLGVKLVGSWEFKPYFVDAAIGYQLEFFKANYISIQNNSPFSELSLRKKINNNWSLGPIVQIQSGVYKTTPTVNEKNELLTNVGLQLLYNQKKDQARYEVSVMNSVAGIDERNLIAIRVGIQIPFGEGDKKQAPVKDNQVVVAKVPVIIVPGFVPKTRYLDQATNSKILFGKDFLGFKLNSSELDYPSLVKLKRLANFLMSDNITIKKIRITGHADKIGTEKYNLKLSQARADAVKQVFIDTNVDSKCLITSTGHSFLKPLINKKDDLSTTKNRRTEIELVGINDRKKLNEELNMIINSEVSSEDDTIITKGK